MDADVVGSYFALPGVGGRAAATPSVRSSLDLGLADVKISQLNKPTLDTDGLVFQVTTLSDAIPDGPQGIWIENALVAKNLVLREREKNDIRYRFVAVDTLLGGGEKGTGYFLIERPTAHQCCSQFQTGQWPGSGPAMLTIFF